MVSQPRKADAEDFFGVWEQMQVVLSCGFGEMTCRLRGQATVVTSRGAGGFFTPVCPRSTVGARGCRQPF